MKSIAEKNKWMSSEHQRVKLVMTYRFERSISICPWRWGA